MVKGVMFDFSGTLFRIESVLEWLGAVVAEAGLDMSVDGLAACAGRLTEVGALPGGAPPRALAGASRGPVA